MNQDEMKLEPLRWAVSFGDRGEVASATVERAEGYLTTASLEREREVFRENIKNCRAALRMIREAPFITAH